VSFAACGVASCCLCLREGRVRLHPSISLSHSLLLLNLSTSSFSSATRLSRSFTWSHRTQLLSLLSSAAKDLDSCVFVWDLHLGPHTPSGDIFYTSGNHGWDVSWEGNVHYSGCQEGDCVLPAGLPLTPCLRRLPRPGGSRSPGAALLREGVWPLPHSSPPRCVRAAAR